MDAVIVYLLPLIVGAALLPAWIILALFLLRGEGGILKALAFAAGAMTVRLVQGVIFGYVFDTAADTYGESGSNLITSTLLLVVGIVMLISAAQEVAQRRGSRRAAAQVDGDPRRVVGAQGFRRGRAVDGWFRSSSGSLRSRPSPSSSRRS